MRPGLRSALGFSVFLWFAWGDGSVPAAVFEWLTGEPAEPGRDGWGFPRLAPEVWPAE